jgi:hypothetical protein
VQRFIAYLIWAGFLALLYRGMIELIVDRLSGRLPEAGSLLEEARHYGWMVGIVLGLLTARLLAR